MKIRKTLAFLLVIAQVLCMLPTIVLPAAAAQPIHIGGECNHMRPDNTQHTYSDEWRISKIGAGESAPRINGVLNDAFWQNSMVSMAPADATVKATVGFKWDDNYLYVGALVEGDSNFTPAKSNGLGSWGSGDFMRLYFSPTKHGGEIETVAHDKQAGYHFTDYNFAFGGNGGTGTAASDCDLLVDSYMYGNNSATADKLELIKKDYFKFYKKDETTWSLEARIPLADLQIDPNVDPSFGFNFELKGVQGRTWTTNGRTDLTNAWKRTDQYGKATLSPAGTPPLSKVSAPTANPASGTTFTAASLDVALSCATNGATLKYTTDGTNPTVSGTEYTAPIKISDSTTIKAVASKEGMESSNIATFSYTKKLPNRSVLDVNFFDGTAKDLSDYNTEPKLTGSPKIIDDPILKKKVLDLNGSQYVTYQLTQPQITDITNAFTFGTVFKADAAVNQTILSNTQQAGLGYEMDDSGLVELWMRIGNTYVPSPKLGFKPELGKYYHLFSTYDGNEVKLYVDGQLKGSASVSGPIKHNSAVPMCIGGDPSEDGSANLNFNGQVSSILIKNYAMSAEEIARDFDKTFGNVTFGAISDVHLEAGDDSDRQARLRKILNKYKANNIKVLMIAGDFSQAGEIEAYQKFNAIFNEIFPDTATAPKKVFTMGNHDYWKPGATAAQAQSTFTSTLGVPLNEHVVVDGYHFISVSTEDRDTHGVFTSSALSWLKTELDKAVADNPTNPIFVTFHQHVKNTVYLSDEWGNEALNTVLKDYPQIITFSGHSHAVLDDERSIHQKDYTSVGTSTLYYTELESGKENGSIPDGAWSVAQGLMGKIAKDKVILERYDVANDRKIKNDWIINLPVNKANFTYTDARADSRTAPTFASSATLTASNVSSSSATLSFASATHDDFVHSYRIEAINKQTGVKKADAKYFSDFYLGLFRMKSAQSFVLKNLDPDTQYTINVYAIESFGKESAPLTTTITTEARSTKAILNVNFSDGTAKDSSSYATPFEFKGTPTIVKDPVLNKNVLDLNGSSHVNYKITDAQRNGMTSALTLGAVFKLDKVADQTIIQNTEGGGIGFETTSDNKIELWLHNGDTYQPAPKLGYQLETGKYYHVFATYDGSTAKLYVDGVKVDEGAVTGNIYHPSVAMCLGGDPATDGGASCLMDGSIASAKIYNTALTAEEIKTDYDKFFASSSQSTAQTTQFYNFEKLCNDGWKEENAPATDIKTVTSFAHTTMGDPAEINQGITIGSSTVAESTDPWHFVSTSSDSANLIYGFRTYGCQLVGNVGDSVAVKLRVSTSGAFNAFTTIHTANNTTDYPHKMGKAEYFLAPEGTNAANLTDAQYSLGVVDAASDVHKWSREMPLASKTLTAGNYILTLKKVAGADAESTRFELQDFILKPTAADSAITALSAKTETLSMVKDSTISLSDIKLAATTAAGNVELGAANMSIVSKDPAKVKVENGNLVAVAEGANIEVVFMASSSITATIKVTVTGAPPQPATAPIITSDPVGEFTDEATITMTSVTDAAKIYYTTDGTDPSAASTEYTVPFKINVTKTFKAIAIKAGMANSAITTATITKKAVGPTAQTTQFYNFEKLCNDGWKEENVPATDIKTITSFAQTTMGDPAEINKDIVIGSNPAAESTDPWHFVSTSSDSANLVYGFRTYGCQLVGNVGDSVSVKLRVSTSGQFNAFTTIHTSDAPADDHPHKMGKAEYFLAPENTDAANLTDAQYSLGIVDAASAVHKWSREMPLASKTLTAGNYILTLKKVAGADAESTRFELQDFILKPTAADSAITALSAKAETLSMVKDSTISLSDIKFAATTAAGNFELNAANMSIVSKNPAKVKVENGKLVAVAEGTDIEVVFMASSTVKAVVKVTVDAKPFVPTSIKAKSKTLILLPNQELDLSSILFSATDGATTREMNASAMTVTSADSSKVAIQNGKLKGIAKCENLQVTFAVSALVKDTISVTVSESGSYADLYDSMLIEHAPEIDGDISDTAWGEMTAMAKTDTDAECTGKFSVKWDDGFLYVAAAIANDTDGVHEGVAWMNGDIVCLYLDPTMHQGSLNPTNPVYDAQIGIGYKTDGGAYLNFHNDTPQETRTALINNSTIRTKKIDEKSWNLEAKIPLSVIKLDPTSGERFGFNIDFENSDFTTLHWAANGTHTFWDNTSGFGRVTFIAPKITKIVAREPSMIFPINDKLNLSDVLFTITDENGLERDINANFFGMQKTSSNPSSISMENGVLHAKAIGKSDLTFTLPNGLSAEIKAEVRDIAKIVITPVAPQECYANMPYHLEIKATNSRDKQMTYTAIDLPEGATFDAGAHSFNWTAPENQISKTTSVVFRVTDGDSTKQIIVPFTVLPEIEFAFDTLADKTIEVNKPFVLFPTFTYSGKKAITISTKETLQNVTIDSENGVFKWTPSNAQLGAHEITLLATDGIATVSTTVKLTVVKDKVDYISFKPIPSQSVYADNRVSFLVEATTTSGKEITYSAELLPSGAKFDAKNRLFTWLPTESDIGVSYAKFKATDGFYTTSISVPITVTSNNTGRPTWGGGGSSHGGYTGGTTPVISTPQGTTSEVFKDMQNHTWAIEAVDALYNYGIIQGTSKDTFSPGKNITRADFVVMLMRTLNLSTDATVNFADVPANAYYAKEVALAKALGITNGFEGNKFRPTAYITRQDMMVLTERALQIAGLLSSNSTTIALNKFEDAGDVSDYAKASTSNLIANNIISGTDDKLLPQSNTTRAEVAVMIYRLVLKYGSKLV